MRSLHGAGFAVCFTYARDRAAASDLVAELGSGRTLAISCDLAQAHPEAVRALVDRCSGHFGAVDVLVNNAGTFAENGFAGDDFAAWRAGWRRTFEVNLFGAVDLTWFALRAMRANEPGARGTRGRIVNVTSRSAHRGEMSFADYGASKAALANFTKSLARGCANDGIVAFSVAPGFIETDMAAEALAHEGEAIRAEIPSGRVGTASEVASVVAFLASGAADYATGTTVDVNGASYVR